MSAPPQAPLQAVVFDLDGTLVETAPDLHLVLSEVMAEEGLPAPPLDALRTMIGDGARALVTRGFAAAGAPLAEADLDRLYARFLALYVARPCRASTLYPGALDVLAALRARGLGLGVCTNKPQRPSELLLDALGIAGMIDCVVGGDVLPVRKPHPDHLRAVVEALGAAPAASVMVGDSRNDLAAARALGVPCVLMSFGYTAVPARELGAEGVVDSFAALPAALEALRPPGGAALDSRPPLA